MATGFNRVLDCKYIIRNVILCSEKELFYPEIIRFN